MYVCTHAAAVQGLERGLQILVLIDSFGHNGSDSMRFMMYSIEWTWLAVMNGFSFDLMSL